MKRRTFLKGGALAVAGTAFGSCGPGDGGPRESRSASAAPADFELNEVGIPELQRRMEEGRESARSICERYLERVDAIDRSGPTLRAVIEVNPEALEIADRLDAERIERGTRGPLHGIPIILKDNIDTADRMHTSAGSLALANSVAPRDAFIVERLREAGAVLLGKANLSEWANFRSTRSSSGWSGRGGQVRNPYILDRNPCGSSSGSGVAVAANLCAAAVGTETDGSVVCPSTANGIVGIKPTLGLLSRSGIIPIAHSQDTAGPMARTVEDAAILLGAMVGVDARDEATQGQKAHRDYTAFLDADGLRGARVGVARNYFSFHSEVDRLMEDAIGVMRDAGAVIVDPANITTEGQFDDTEYEVLLYEFKADLNAYLSGLSPEVTTRTLADLIAFNENHAADEMPFFGQEIFIAAQDKGPLTEKAYVDALKKNRRLTRDEGIDAALRKDRLDVIVAPTGGPAWTTDLVNGDHFLGSSSSPAAVAGYPNVTVPAGFVHGLPVGISFFSTAYAEPTVIKIAYAFEQTTKHRKAPEFIPSLA